MTRLGCWLTGPLEGDEERPVLERIALLAEAAERAGFDSFWVTDTPPPGGPEAGSGGHGGLEAYSLLGALATRTRTMRLGAVPFGPSAGGRPPSMVVKIVTAIDVLSHGRGIVAFGMGSNGDRAGDKDSDGDVRRVVEALRVGRTMLEDEAPTFAGSIYAVDRAFNRPGPVQKGGVPLVVVAPVSGDALEPLAGAPDGSMASAASAARSGRADAVIVRSGVDDVRAVVTDLAGSVSGADPAARPPGPEVLGVVTAAGEGTPRGSRRVVDAAGVADLVRAVRDAGADGCLVVVDLAISSADVASIGAAAAGIDGAVAGPPSGARRPLSPPTA